MVAGMGIFASGMNTPDHLSFKENNAQFAKAEGSLMGQNTALDNTIQ